ncbi:hypothetical protein AX17_006573 [Amanita inopinata Kibby_2008]|nr:hypothetical protein AX17_006573 [Amanita inopinata Kibby_2008]
MSAFTRTLSRHTFLKPRQVAKGSRTFYSPFTVLGNSPLTVPPSPASTVSSMYEKQNDHSPELFVTSAGTRTYVVSEPDASSRYYQVPSGAYPTSAPYVNFTATEAPDVASAQISSTSSDLLAHPVTMRAVPRHAGGVGESSAIRHMSAPGEMGKRGGSYGGEGMVDKAGTIPGEGKQATRNPPPVADVVDKAADVGLGWRTRR